MRITASIQNTSNANDILLSTEGNEKRITIPNKKEGRGSSVNGGELLCLALATCFCNDIYREAAKRGMTVDSVDVTVRSVFGKEGEPASNIEYDVEVKSPHSTAEITDLIKYVDDIAEVHNTLRKGLSVSLKQS